jgi:hypothetical protein
MERHTSPLGGEEDHQLGGEDDRGTRQPRAGTVLLSATFAYQRALDLGVRTWVS